MAVSNGQGKKTRGKDNGINACVIKPRTENEGKKKIFGAVWARA